MFANASDLVGNFTRPVKIITRNYRKNAVTKKFKSLIAKKMMISHTGLVRIRRVNERTFNKISVYKLISNFFFKQCSIDPALYHRDIPLL